MGRSMQSSISVSLQYHRRCLFGSQSAKTGVVVLWFIFSLIVSHSMGEEGVGGGSLQICMALYSLKKTKKKHGLCWVIDSGFHKENLHPNILFNSGIHPVTEDRDTRHVTAVSFWLEEWHNTRPILITEHIWKVVGDSEVYNIRISGDGDYEIRLKAPQIVLVMWVFLGSRIKF